MKCRAALVSLAVVALLAACTKNEVAPGAESGQEPAVTPDEAQLIAEQAYVYAYPMMENYRTMYVQAIDRTAPGYLAPFNELVHKTELLGPDFKDIVRPNNDTVYSMGWIDLRAQPLVITVPQIEDRYFSVQLIDMFTHNFAYMGTRATNGESGSYLVAGPQWKGTKPGDTKAVYRSESNFVYCIVRVEVRGPHDLEAANAIQRGFRLTPLHVFLSRSRAPVAAGITFPMYDPDKARSSGFIDLFNFLLEQVVIVPEEQELMQRFARIGIQPGHRAASLAFDLATRDAIDEGIGEALKRVSSNATDPSGLDGVVERVEEGWAGLVGMFGSGAEMRGKYMARAVAAMMGLYGNDAVEAYYPTSSSDESGNRYDGSRHSYVLRFEKDEMPPVEAFWSMTVYSLPDQLMVANPIGRYSIGDRSKLRYAKDGSLTIYIQHQSPGKKREGNWLPAPDGAFSLQFRMYLPRPGALEDPLYLPPPVAVAK